MTNDIWQQFTSPITNTFIIAAAGESKFTEELGQIKTDRGR